MIVSDGVQSSRISSSHLRTINLYRNAVTLQMSGMERASHRSTHKGGCEWQIHHFTRRLGIIKKHQVERERRLLQFQSQACRVRRLGEAVTVPVEASVLM
jgi:hypothetical protein